MPACVRASTCVEEKLSKDMHVCVLPSTDPTREECLQVSVATSPGCRCSDLFGSPLFFYFVFLFFSSRVSSRYQPQLRFKALKGKTIGEFKYHSRQLNPGTEYGTSYVSLFIFYKM